MATSMQQFIETFSAFNINAIYSIIFFLKHNFFFIFVLFAIGYLIYTELKTDSYKYVNDERRMI